MNKINSILVALVFCNTGVRCMQSKPRYLKSPLSQTMPTPQLNSAMIEFACYIYETLGINHLAEAFALCEERFPEHAQLAKLYVYFQATHTERWVQEELLLKTFDIPALLKRYPELPPPFGNERALLALQHHLRETYPNARALSELDRLYHRLKELDELAPAALSSLIETLIEDDHVPFLAYVQKYMTDKKKWLSRPSRDFGSYYDWCCDIREQAYTKLTGHIQAHSVVGVQTLIEFYQLNPNHLIVSDCTTPLAIATTGGRIPMIHMLLAHGGDPSQAIPCYIKNRRSDWETQDTIAPEPYEQAEAREYAQWKQKRLAAHPSMSDTELEQEWHDGAENIFFNTWTKKLQSKHWQTDETEISALSIAQRIVANSRFPTDEHLNYLAIVRLFKKTIRSSASRQSKTTGGAGPAAATTQNRDARLANARRKILLGMAARRHLNKPHVEVVPPPGIGCSCTPKSKACVIL